MEEIFARLERLERLTVERYSSGGEPKSPRGHHYPHVPAPAITIRGMSVKDGMRTRIFGQNSPKVLLNLVRICSSYKLCYVEL